MVTLRSPSSSSTPRARCCHFCPSATPLSDLRFRFWEIAGTSHTGDMMSVVTALLGRDFGVADAARDVQAVADANTVRWQPVADAALHQLQRWLTTEDPPPSMPWVDVDGAPPTIQLDKHGNAHGGVRLPEIDVPITRRSAEPMTAPGSKRSSAAVSRFLPPDKLRSLYPDHATYVSAYAAAAQRAVEAGTLRPPGRQTDGRADGESGPAPPLRRPSSRTRCTPWAHGPQSGSP